MQTSSDDRQRIRESQPLFGIPFSDGAVNVNIIHYVTGDGFEGGSKTEW